LPATTLKLHSYEQSSVLNPLSEPLAFFRTNCVLESSIEII
jgi:hypothetical protein